MARARSLKPGFFRNADLLELPFEVRLLFAGLWTIADRAGRLEDRPKQIKIELFPADNVDIDEMLSLLEKTKMLIRYEVNGDRYIQVVNFSKHQNPHRDERDSTIPAYNNNNSNLDEAQCKHSASTVQKQVDNDATSEPIGLTPLTLNLTPESTPPHNPPKGGKVRCAIEFKTFLADCRAAGERPIADYTPALDYAQSVKLPEEFLHLCWNEFYRRHNAGGATESKRYKDWRRAFRNCLEGNWYKLWWLNPATNGFELTTAGRVAQRADDASRQAAA